MTDERKISTFSISSGVFDSMAEDEGAMAAYEALLPDAWRDAVRAVGGEPVGEPRIERHENMGYGWPIPDAFDEDGQPVIDHVKLWLRVVGRAVEPS